MTQFQELIWGYYRASGRDLPWRPPTLAIGPDDTLDPYLVVVSEIMLQQTQVARVLEKFSVFSLQFPN
ncbi:MAG TPA: hypothetical protein VK963_00095, partial [Candidatus Saccharimonadales bacterium]|nr:hypothetical protein [Candidatus Saccharimonadales bacterium]